MSDAIRMYTSYHSFATKQMTTQILASPKAIKIAGVLGVAEAQVAAMIDVAMAIAQANEINLETSLPNFTILDEAEGGPSLGIEFRIPVTSREAVLMGWQLSEQIIEKGLHLPGVYVDFLGCGRPKRTR